MTSAKPNFAGVEAAASRLGPYLTPTPLIPNAPLSRAFDAEVWLKVETVTPIASFKLRGALNHLLLAREHGPITAAVTSSTGNHGQGVAYSARLLGIPAEIFLPDGSPAVKQAMIRLFGGRLHLGGLDIDDAKDRARRFCQANNGIFVDDGESAPLIEGAGTIGHEIAGDLGEIDHVFLPMGSGSLASGTAIGLKGRQPNIKVTAVQAEGSPAMVESFHARRAIERPCDTIGDCIMCRVPAETALQALIEHVDDALLVSDRELLGATHTLIAWAHLLVEPGAAAGLAGAWRKRDELRGRRIVIALTGANVDPAMVRRALETPQLCAPPLPA